MVQVHLKLLLSNIEKLEKLVDDLVDNIDSKKKKIEYLNDQIASNIKEIDEIIKEYNANN